MTEASFEEEKDGPDPDYLSLWILRECIISTVEALRSTVGEEGTKSAISPYLINAAKAFTINMRDKVAEDGFGIRILKVWLWGNNALTGAARSISVGPTEVLLINSGCPFEGRAQELCNVLCQLGAETMMRDIRPDYSFQQTPAHETMDHTCTWRAYWNEGGPVPNAQTKIFDAKEYLNLWTDEEKKWLSHHVTAEFWLSTIRALEDQIGADDAAVILEPFMREVGALVFSKLNNKLGPPEKSARTAACLISQINELENQNGTEILSGDRVISKRIVECPFCDSPEIFCKQYEVMCDAICKEVSPDLSFRYESMISRGDPNCVWVISSKENARTKDGKKKGDEPGSQTIDPLRVLLQRLARGEISREEYEELKAFISSELKDRPKR